ncbi:MAG: helix-turn-helix domain-containing protein [Ignavibacteriaceae bacterium]
MNINKTYIYLWDSQFLFIGNAIKTKIHAHHVLQIGISVDHPFKMRVKNESWQSYKGIIVGSDQNHECIATDSKVIFISIDPESVNGKKLIKHYLKNSPYNSIQDQIVNQFVKDLENQFSISDDCKDILRIVNDLINRLTLSSELVTETDKRIESAIQILKNSIHKKITVKQLAQEVYMSESRLIHLFKKQIGIPIRKYILWLKLKTTTEKIIHKETLTQAAYSGGFSDSAHFSRTFTRMFGISPSAILKNSQIVQARSCSE